MAATMPMEADTGEQAPPEQAPADDLSQGYCIEISVLPDGTYQVAPPEPLQAEAAEEQGEPGSEAGQTYPNIGEALKQVLSLIKANPVGESEQGQFDAGYGAG